MNLEQAKALDRWLIQFRNKNLALLKAVKGIEVVFSRVKPAAWPPLHAARSGENRTLCGLDITVDWDGDGDCTALDVECKRCLTILIADAK